MALEVKVKELVLEPPGQAGGHLGLELLHVVIPRGGEVPLQDLQGNSTGINMADSSVEVYL